MTLLNIIKFVEYSVIRYLEKYKTLTGVESKTTSPSVKSPVLNSAYSVLSPVPFPPSERNAMKLLVLSSVG